jgi:uncharacterized protein (DUF488 family)
VRGTLMNPIYTIGYTAFKIDDFIKTLRLNHISCVIDVRSIPMSRYYLDYNKENISLVLKQNGILYRNYIKEFGARQNNMKFYSKEGYLDFNKFTQSQQFKAGINKVLAGMQIGYIFALMCAEKDPINCHRSIMIGRQFYQKDILVNNIMANGATETQADLEKRLLDLYYPNRDQITLTGNYETDEELINRSYQKRNAEIGFKLEGE